VKHQRGTKEAIWVYEYFSEDLILLLKLNESLGYSKLRRPYFVLSRVVEDFCFLKNVEILNYNNRANFKREGLKSHGCFNRDRACFPYWEGHSLTTVFIQEASLLFFNE